MQVNRGSVSGSLAHQGGSCLLPWRHRRTGERTRPERIRRVERRIPLSGGMPRDEGLDPRPPSRELPLRPPMVGSHSAQQVRLRPLRVDAAEVVPLSSPTVRCSVRSARSRSTSGPRSREPAPRIRFPFHTSKWRYIGRGLRPSRERWVKQLIASGGTTLLWRPRLSTAHDGRANAKGESMGTVL